MGINNTPGLLPFNQLKLKLRHSFNINLDIIFNSPNIQEKMSLSVENLILLSNLLVLYWRFSVEEAWNFSIK